MTATADALMGIFGFKRVESEMKTDRELLELAAKAAGMGELVYMSETERYAVVWLPVGADNNEWDFWNPLTDDSDALRLAVGIGAVIQPKGPGVEVWVFESRLSSGVVEYGDDPCSATRRAIVRAAAAIGEAM